MIARAPGKLVLSGAYSVLDGAPAIVAAVDRYATADTGRAATFVSGEVAAAIEAGALARAPWFDASALRAPLEGGGTRKLGLGSSAAILVASIAAARAESFGEIGARAQEIFDLARAAHFAAQHGGSGIDVAASAFGGVLVARLDVHASSGVVAPALSTAQHALPQGAIITVFASRSSTSTASFVAAVGDLAKRSASLHESHLADLGEGARAAIAASDTVQLIAALEAQFIGLAALGDAAGVPIVPSAWRPLGALARGEGATFGPSGAGGGDVAIFVGKHAPSVEFMAAASRAELDALPVKLGARGVHLASS